MRLQHESSRLDVQQRIPRRALGKSRQEIEGQGFEIKRQRCSKLVALRIEFIRLAKSSFRNSPYVSLGQVLLPGRIPSPSARSASVMPLRLAEIAHHYYVGLVLAAPTCQLLSVRGPRE